MEKEIRVTVRTCLCGCGEEVPDHSFFVTGHDARMLRRFGEWQLAECENLPEWRDYFESRGFPVYEFRTGKDLYGWLKGGQVNLGLTAAASA